MSIEFPCPSCTRPLRVPDGSEGRQARCPACSTTCTVPGGAAANSGATTPGSGGPPGGNPFRDGAGGLATNPFKPDSSAQVNPYAAPAPMPMISAPASGTKGELRATRLEFGQVLGRTWEIVSNRFGECALAGLALAGCYIGLQVVGQVMGVVAQVTREPAIVIGVGVGWNLVVQALGLWLQLGLVNFGLKMSRTGQGSAGDLFQVGPYFARGLGIYLVMMLVVLGVIVACAIPPVAVLIAQGGPNGVEKEPVPIIVTIAICFLVAMILTTWITLRWKMAYEFVIDRNAGVFEALSLSSQYMQGNKFTVFLMLMVIGLVMPFVVLCTLCIGSIITYPFMGVISAVIYLMGTGQPHAQFLPSAAQPQAAPR